MSIPNGILGYMHLYSAPFDSRKGSRAVDDQRDDLVPQVCQPRQPHVLEASEPADTDRLR